ncbi:MAG: protein-glutamate O-methyltransferase CheR [Cyanobacteria bacterium P01_B01_bin.77]
MPPKKLLSPQITQAFAELITDRIGVILRKNDYISIQEFISNRIKATGFKQPEDYYQLLRRNTTQSHQEWKLLISKITNTESFFFRDQGQFKLLRNYIFPKLIEQKSHQKKLRIFSAGCSTGEEPYSVAILLKEIIPDLKDWDIKILGVDVNAAAIQNAQKGIYRPWSFRGIDNTLQQRFFKEAGNFYHIYDEIKDMVNFQVGNLLDDSDLDPFSNIKNMDLILCRNVFIYFNDLVISKVIDKIYDALCPSGYLLVGHTELHSQNSNKFHIKVFDESIAYQRPQNHEIKTVSEFLSIQTAPDLSQIVNSPPDQQTLGELFRGNDIRMHRAALNLLRQLPGDSRIAKLDNCTASELITQLEKKLQETD